MIHKKILSTVTALALAVSVMPLHSGYAKYTQVTDGSTVQSIPNREAYYELDGDSADNWTKSREDDINLAIDGSSLTFSHTHSGNATVARYVTDAPESPKGNVIETSFDVSFSDMAKDSSIDIVGEEIKATGNENPNSILRIVVDSDDKGVYIYDGEERSPINITQYTGYSYANGKISTGTFRIHAVMNFQTKDIDLDIYIQ